MYCRVCAVMINGVEVVPVTVEADVSSGLPSFSIVGSPSAHIREAQDRVRTALQSLDIRIPPKRITINLAPGDMRKDGTRFDLPIAAIVLGAIGIVPPDRMEDTMIIGELMLDGLVGRITGVMPSVLAAREAGMKTCMVPADNLREAEIIEGIRIVGIRSLSDMIRYFKEPETPERPAEGGGRNLKGEENTGKKRETGEKSKEADFGEIAGQEVLKRCCMIAAAGFHNLLISGPPGSGKTMAAVRMPGIMTEMTAEERLEISNIYSIAGLLSEEEPLLTKRPFRAPHHTITAAALGGGGRHPKPGEITLAHKGVLFLDEMPEMKRETVELLRQPLEERKIVISRAGGTYTFPADFLLIGAMNPCPCGYYPDRNKCKCSEWQVRAYQKRISRAVIDRIDIRCRVEAVTYEELTGRPGQKRPKGLDSAEMKKRVENAARIQTERYRNREIRWNHDLTPSAASEYCILTDDAVRMIERAYRTLELSARSYHLILKTARTIADLEESSLIREEHISEALMYR